jgi:hypothetical protein
LSITNEEVEYMTIEDRRKAEEIKRGKTQKKKEYKRSIYRRIQKDGEDDPSW